MPSSKDFLFLAKLGSRNATLPQVCHKQHVPHGQNHRHVLYRHLLCHRFCLDPDPRQLLLISWFNGYVDSFKIYLSIVIVFQGLESVSSPSCATALKAAVLSVPSSKTSHGYPPPDHLPRRPLGPCQPSHRVPCTQHRHIVGRDKQRGREHDVFGRGTADSGKIQVHDCILFCHDSRYGGVEWSWASQVCVTRDQSAA